MLENCEDECDDESIWTLDSADLYEKPAEELNDSESLQNTPKRRKLTHEFKAPTPVSRGVRRPYRAPRNILSSDSSDSNGEKRNEPMEVCSNRLFLKFSGIMKMKCFSSMLI